MCYDNNKPGELIPILITEQKTQFTVEDISIFNIVDGLAKLKNSYSYTAYDGQGMFGTPATVNLDFVVYNIAD